MGLKNFFFESDEEERVKPTPKKSIVQDISVTSSAIQPINPVYTTVAIGESAEFQKFRTQFAKILEDENKRNYPGNDYFEFTVMKNAMNAIPQEQIRYQAAFAGWSTGGNQSKKSLLDTAQIYLGLVDKEIKEFEEAYQHQYQQQISKTEELIAQKSRMVQDYLEKMNVLNAEITTLKQQNIANTANLTNKHEAFMAAGQSQRQEILTEVDKINQFIN